MFVCYALCYYIKCADSVSPVMSKLDQKLVDMACTVVYCARGGKVMRKSDALRLHTMRHSQKVIGTENICREENEMNNDQEVTAREEEQEILSLYSKDALEFIEIQVLRLDRDGGSVHLCRRDAVKRMSDGAIFIRPAFKSIMNIFQSKGE